jgi:N4-gp56 family major capsid protein
MAALTLVSTEAASVKSRYYDELFLRVAESNLIHKQLGQLDRQVGAGQGGYGSNVLHWARFVNPTTVTSGSGEGTATSAVTLSAVTVTGTSVELDNAITYSDILAYTSFGDFKKAAMERLAYNAGISIDTYVRSQVYNSGSIMRAEGAAHFSTITSTGVLALSGVRKAVRRLRANDAMPLADGSFVAVIHPDVAYDLEGDTTVGGWITTNTYGPSVDKILAGEIGKLYGVRFLETSNGATIAGSSTYVGSTTIHVTSFFGRDAFGVSNLKNLKTYIKDFGSAGTADPTDKIASIGWRCVFGAAMLNSSFAVNYQSVVTSTG